PNINYYRCNYNLREDFYPSEKWNINNCEPYTIMTGQTNYPLKGLHNLLHAVSILKSGFPEVKVKIPGAIGINNRGMITNGYYKYIHKLISNYGLKDSVEWLGKLDAKGIITNLLSSNIVVVPSATEGASATLCEA